MFELQACHNVLWKIQNLRDRVVFHSSFYVQKGILKIQLVDFTSDEDEVRVRPCLFVHDYSN